jgi:hypothetical protein
VRDVDSTERVLTEGAAGQNEAYANRWPGARIASLVAVIQRGRVTMSKIDDAADKVKRGTDKAADATKNAAKQGGEKIKNAGNQIKKQGK